MAARQESSTAEALEEVNEPEEEAVAEAVEEDTKGDEKPNG